MSDDASAGSGDIDVTIPGSVESVDGAASWLEDLRDNLRDGRLMFTNNATQANGSLSGELASAVTAFSNDLSTAADDAYNRAKSAADTIRSFADQLSWRKDDMNDHLETARGYDLDVDGNIIHYPEAVSDPGDLPKGATKDEKNAWYEADEAYDAYCRKVTHFEKVRTKVNATFVKLNDWIDENLVTTESDVLDNSAITGVKALLASSLDAGYGTLVNNNYIPTVNILRSAAEQAAIRAAQDSSKNPQVHARSARPSDTAISKKRGKGDSGKLSKTADTIEGFGKFARDFGSVAITLGFAGADLANGESPSETILTATTGAIAGEMAGPAGVVVGPAVAAGTSYAYETWVSQETRDKIDEGLVDAKDWTADTVADGWESLTEGVGDAADWVKDSWKML